jgi:hypothetical protein
MKTYSRLRLSLVAISLLLLIGTTTVQAQDRGRGARGRSEYRGGIRGHDGRTYYRRAPWGMHRPYALYHNHARVYYYGGHYWQYYPDLGYGMTEVPGDYYFDAVPQGFRRVWIDGRWCYRRGDLYLRPGVHGYVAFPGPGVRIGVGF